MGFEVFLARINNRRRCVNMEEQMEGDGRDGNEHGGEYVSRRLVCTRMRIHVAYDTPSRNVSIPGSVPMTHPA